MPKNLKQDAIEEPPTVVQIVYQVPSEEAPMLPEQLSVLEGRTGIIVIIIFAIWGLLWYGFSRQSEKSQEFGAETPISVNDF